MQWTLTLIIVGSVSGFSLSAREHVVRPLQTMSNLLAALREGDYSIRARGARADDALGEVLLEINALGETLRLQRLGAFEATALSARSWRKSMSRFSLSIPSAGLRLVNRAGENLLGQPIDKLLGRRASDLGLAVCLDADEDAPLDSEFSRRVRALGSAAKQLSRTRFAARVARPDRSQPNTARRRTQRLAATRAGARP